MPLRLIRGRTPKVICSVVSATMLMGTLTLNANATTTSETIPTALQKDWNAIVSTSPSLMNATVSAYAYDVTTHQVLAAVNPDLRQTPASITKLVTSAAALATMGPNYQYNTQVAVPKESSSSTPNPIYLIGGGDPWLEANGEQDLESLASQVAAKVKIATRVIGVNSLFTPPIYGIGWPLGDLSQNYAAGTSALMAERSEIQVVVTGTTPGQAPTAHLMFNSSAQAPEFFHIINNATTLQAGQASTLTITRELGTNNIVLSGGIAPGKTASSILSIGDPALFAATLFQDLLKADGVTFSSGPTTGTLPSGTETIATHTSDTLANYLTIQNQYSINQMAENLYRMLGVAKSGTGSLNAASTAMTTFLHQAGVSTNGMQLVDGSGLSPLDEMSSKQMVQLLTYATTQSWFQVFKQSLMQVNSANNAGILSGHPFNLPTGTDVWVKTGNLSNQWNYAGYAQAENGDLIAFAILDDGPPTYLNSQVGSPLDQMIVDAASWPNEPTPPSVQTVTASNTATATKLPPELASLQSQLVSADTGSVIGASIVNAETRKTVWSLNANKLLRAGLLPRLAVADAALNGSEQFKGVTVEADGTLTNGTLKGSLVVDGNGDPTLTKEDLTRLAKMVYHAGIHSITGPVEYVDPYNLSPWSGAIPQNDVGQAWAPPQSSLVVDKDMVQVTIKARAPGQSPIVTVDPADAPIKIDNELSVASGSESTQVKASLRLGTDTYVLNGTLAPGKTTTVQIAPPNAGQVAAVAFRDALMNSHITVPSKVQSVIQDPGAKIIASLPGPSIASLVPLMLENPSSVIAQQVLELLGPNASQELTNALGSVDQVEDATGIGLENYVTPTSITDLLSAAYNQPKEAPLRQYLTYHLWTTEDPEVRTIAGYVRGSNGTVYAVSIIQSDLLWNGRFAPVVNP